MCISVFWLVKQRFWFLFSDNVFAIKSWTKKKFSFDDSHINKAFGIPEDFDYMDWLPAFLPECMVKVQNKCLSFQFEASIPYLSSSSYVLCSNVKGICMALCRLWIRPDFSNFAVADGIYQLICCIGATRKEMLSLVAVKGEGVLWWTQLSSLSFGTPVCMKTESPKMMMEKN